jgi:hypothetical protein
MFAPFLAHFLNFIALFDSFFFFRLRQHSIERAMDLTDRFTWEDLPTRDAETGHLTAAGWIRLIMRYMKRATVVVTSIHCVQSTVRIVTNHETMFIVWYPIDWTVSPFYELVNASQVIIFVYKKDIILIKVMILPSIKASGYIPYLLSSLSLFFFYDAVSLPDCKPG